MISIIAFCNTNLLFSAQAKDRGKLHQAIQTEDLQKVGYYIKSGVSPNDRCPKTGNAALHTWIEAGQPAFLLHCKVALKTMFHIKSHRYQILDLLLAHKASTTLINYQGDTFKEHVESNKCPFARKIMATLLKKHDPKNALSPSSGEPANNTPPPTPQAAALDAEFAQVFWGIFK